MATERTARRAPTCAVAIAWAVLAAAPAAVAQTPSHEFGEDYGGSADHTPEEIEDVDIVEKLGDELPLDLPFRDEDGVPVALGDLFEPGVPVILTFNYSDCPMLCSVQLGALVDAMGKMQLRPGRQFRIITVTLDPTETPEVASETKAGYLDRLDQGEEAASGWRFLTGSKKSIEALTEAVGFQYEYSPEKNEYFHPPALVFASPSGSVSSYLYGVSYEPDGVSGALSSAALGDTRESAEKFILSCFVYDRTEGHAFTAFQIMRFGGIGFVLLAGGVATGYVVIKKTRKPRREQLRS